MTEFVLEYNNKKYYPQISYGTWGGFMFIDLIKDDRDIDISTTPYEVNYSISFDEMEKIAGKIREIGGKNLIKIRNKFYELLLQKELILPVSEQTIKQIMSTNGVDKDKRYTWAYVNDKFIKEYYSKE